MSHAGAVTSDRPETPPIAGVGLTIEGLTYSYRRGGDELYRGLTYAFARSSLTVVTGPSGRGKSTLLYLLGLLIRPTAGAIFLDGQRVDDRRDGDRSKLRANRVGFIFQDAVLDPTRPILDSVIEPALYAGRARGASDLRARALLAELGIADRMEHRPGQISGGQAQRVAIARALMNEPDVILADEPTGNLDRANAEVVLHTLAKEASVGRTVVLATHDPSVVNRADQVLGL